MPLTRQLEPEVMDSYGDAAEYDAMNHGLVNRAFVRDLLALAGEPEGEVLDLGAGTARIPIELCRTVEFCRVVATDLSSNMLNIAQVNIEIAELTDRIILHRVDATALPYTDGRFDGVISNSLIHHLPQPQAALAEAVRVVSASGLLFFRDLLRPDDEASLAQLVTTYAGQESPRARQLFADSLHAALDLAEIQAYVVELGFTAASVQQTSDRHWTWQARACDRAPREMA